jgi:hypothetical protein
VGCPVKLDFDQGCSETLAGMDHGFPKAETFLWRRIVVGEQAQGHFAERGLGL